MHDAARIIRSKFPHIVIEASGGITEDNVTSFMGSSVDVISLSKTTQGYGIVDFSMKIKKAGHDPDNPVIKQCV